MAFRFAVAVFGVVALASQSYAGCLCPPPACAPIDPPALTPANLPPWLQSALAAAAPPPLPAAALPAPPCPAAAAALPAPPCAADPLVVPEPSEVTEQKPDNIIPLPLPSQIPLAHICVCQKHIIRPSLVPTVAAPPACAPTPACAPKRLLAPAPLAGNPSLLLAKLKGLLASLPKAAPPKCSCCA